MKIKDIKIYVIQVPLDEPFFFAQGMVHVRSSVIVEAISEDNISGFGECLCHGMQPPKIAAAIIENLCIPQILGRSIFDIGVIWEHLYNISRPFGQGAIINALSGLDIALWDLMAKTLNQPISNLLGGKYRSSVEAYATGFYRKEGKEYPKDAIKEALSHVAKGFKGMKLKVGFDLQEDIHYIKAVRKAVGYDVKLMVDFNCAYNRTLAKRIIKELEEEKIEFFEELLVPEDMDGYKILRETSTTAIAAGENLFGKFNYLRWMQQGALDIYQPDLCSNGGFTECMKIVSFAQATNSIVIPHVWGSGIGLAASLQFISAISPTPLSLKYKEPLLEYDQSSHPFRSDLIYDAIKMVDGRVEIPQNPGIGVEVNREVLEKYKI